MQIDKTKIGIRYSPYVIAEMSGNHNQSLDRAIKMVEAAAKTGVNALKLQTYTAETITLDNKSSSSSMFRASIGVFPHL